MWGFVILFVLVMLVSAVVALAAGRRGMTAAVLARRTALAFAAICTLLIGLFIAGETFADPGGWLAAGITALWLVPLAALSLLAWYRPRWAVAALVILLAGVTGLAIWFAADPAGWRAFEDSHGPVRAVVSFILVLPSALAGWHRPAAGAALLLPLGLIPLAIATAAAGAFGASSLAAVSIPAVLGGLLYLLAALQAGRENRPVHSLPACRPLPFATGPPRATKPPRATGHAAS
jgi:hypothetical protein